MNRTSFLIDGFNLYHSVRDIQRDFGLRTKWLDIYALCKSFLQWVGDNAVIQNIYYFSAYAYHLNDPDIIERHETYIKCLRDTGIKDEMSRFKEKEITCPKYNPHAITCEDCNGRILRHEEKETDVSMAIKLYELFSTNACDTAVLVTGDTDLVPVIKTSNTLFPTKSIKFIFPYLRKNKEIANLAPSLTIKPKQYQKFQLPDPFQLADGTTIPKPSVW